MNPKDTIVIVTCGAQVELFHYVNSFDRNTPSEVLYPIPRGALALPVTDAEILVTVQNDLLDMNDDGSGRKSASLSRIIQGVELMRSLLAPQRRDEVSIC